MRLKPDWLVMSGSDAIRDVPKADRRSPNWPGPAALFHAAVFLRLALRQAPGAVPTNRLNTRLKAAGEA